MFNPEPARGLTETYVLEVDGDAFTARIVDGELETSCGAAADADLVVETDKATFFLLCAREIEPLEAVKMGRAKFEGEDARWSPASAC